MPDLTPFTQVYDREGTAAEKYLLCKALFGRDDVLPMWVADMDLPTPDFIIEALQQRLQHPLLGYTLATDTTYRAIIDWQAQHGYSVKASEIVFTHNVANGFFMAVSAFTQPGDGVLVTPPVYPPFMQAPILQGRQTVEAPLILQNGSYQMDFAAMEQAMQQHNVKLMLLCNPQNPSGRVWQSDELAQLVDLCIHYGVTLVSDEIHSDLVYPGYQHTPTASLSEQAAQITVTLSSPGKTFNLGGLQIGYAIIANPQLKAAYLKVCQANAISGLNLFALTALQAAYSLAGKQWRDRLMAHFSRNIDRLEAFLGEHLPDVNLMRPQASYLVWLDFRARFETHAALKNWLVESAKLGLSDGESFGGESGSGTGFMRINLAVPTPVLEQALHQLKSALERSA
ncbi:PatB family C-S lyase [Thiomicrorhabdus cannonii]|uniref:PatB family C-S lyase n=1 Tax=Thiomicrorhabdus cannonii TaxID=2748011 RepID=UPI0015BE21DB|nr:PatB family C-S lyase [Thiomicrorhabdus cannonii]